MRPPTSNTVAPPHNLLFPFNIRRAVGGWKLVNYRSAAFSPETDKSAPFNRGKYLVEHAAHCGECHTPRNLALGLDNARAFQGSPGFDGVTAPSIDSERLKAYGPDAFVEGVFQQGLHLDGAPLQEQKMAEVVANISQLTVEDRRAIYDYLTDLPMH